MCVIFIYLCDQYVNSDHLESVNDIIAASRANEERNSSLLGFAEMQQVRHNYIYIQIQYMYLSG